MTGYDVIMLNDPELVLPHDVLPPGRILAVGEAVGGQQEFATIAALVATRDQVEAELGRLVRPWQDLVAPPAYVARHLTDLTVYGYVMDHDAIIRAEEAATPGPTIPAQLHNTLERIDDARRRGWLYGKWFSRVEPRGEPGCTHRAHLSAILTQGEFERAALAGWPTVP